MEVLSVAADRFRSLEGVELELGQGTTAIHGPNGSGKTNLIEAAYFVFTGRSFRSGDRRDLIPFGADHMRVRAVVEDDEGTSHEFMTASGRSGPTRTSLDGAQVELREVASLRPSVAVFAPDRLEIIKGPPATRRARLDSYVGARWPSRGNDRRDFGRALAQRNALLRKIAAGVASEGQLDAWDAQVSAAGESLVEGRREAAGEIGAEYPECSMLLGLEADNRLEYRTVASTAGELAEGLAERRATDLEAGRTTWGPHNDEVRIEFDGRQLRRFGSQGQQRTGLLALLFAERRALLASGAPLPLMLLDDVMSELDGTRRGALIEMLGAGGQAVITAVEEQLIPEGPGVTLVGIGELTSPSPPTGGAAG